MFRDSAISSLLVISLAVAQAPGKRPLTHADYDGWKSIVSQKISPDGRYVAYGLFPQDGDGELIVFDLTTGKEMKHPAGALPPPAAPDPLAEAPPPQRGLTIEFSADSKYVVSSAYPSKADLAKARAEKRRPDQAPRNAMLIGTLADAKFYRVENVRSFQVPDEASGYIAYSKEPVVAGASATPAVRRPVTGSDLILRKLDTDADKIFGEATEYKLADDAKQLVYAVASKEEAKNGVYVVIVGIDAGPRTLVAGKGKYTRLTTDEKGGQFAFLADTPQPRLLHWDRQANEAAEIATALGAGMRAGFEVSTNGTLEFSRDGGKLFFGTVPAKPKDEKKADPSEEKAVFDLWHYKDDFIQPMQKVRATQDRNRSFRAVYHVAERKLVQLADATMPGVIVNDDGTVALGLDDRGYRRMREYDTTYNDLYFVDTKTGARAQIGKQVQGSASWSPDGRHAIAFDGADWILYGVDGSKRNITSILGTSFTNRHWDLPARTGASGLPQWTKDGKYALIPDNFDIWMIAADGSVARNLTEFTGKRNNVQYRVVRTSTDRRDRGIDAAQPLLLRGENVETHETGYFRDSLDGTAEPQKLVWGARDYKPVVKAKNSDVLMLAASTFTEYQDILITDSSMAKMRKISNANPQQSQYTWGTPELIGFKNADGVPLQATLYKPENMTPGKKYPLMVYIYERLSQNIHNYVSPAPGHSVNIACYVSNGYLVLTPDIAYTIGYPGPSALKAVLPAIDAVVALRFVDENAIGIQGHSWGGYQIAWMVTQTKRFKAAAPGAVVTNMISAYNGVRWGPGLPRQFQYEKSQSRIGGTPWQYPLRFVENSPIFMADRVTTPLLTLHNDADDAVPWYQGIEHFLSLRRMGKEVYMFNYNGEPHGIRKRANQKDYTRRLQEFFDHHLKGAPKPDWMERGRPFLEKEPGPTGAPAATDGGTENR